MGINVDAVSHRVRKGQALIELAAGMLALALVLAAIVSFAMISLSSLKAQRELRREVGQQALNGFGTGLIQKGKPVKAEVSSLIFGHTDFSSKEKVALPNMSGL